MSHILVFLGPGQIVSFDWSINSDKKTIQSKDFGFMTIINFKIVYLTYLLSKLFWNVFNETMLC